MQFCSRATGRQCDSEMGMQSSIVTAIGAAELPRLCDMGLQSSHAPVSWGGVGLRTGVLRGPGGFYEHPWPTKPTHTHWTTHPEQAPYLATKGRRGLRSKNNIFGHRRAL